MRLIRRPIKGRPTGIILALTLASSLMAQAPTAVDALFEKFFAAQSPADALVVADLIAASSVDFDAAYARLRKGRTYLDEKRGEYSLRWRSKSGPFFNNVADVPADYDPSKPLQLRVQLHGGVGRPSPNAVAPGRQTSGWAAA